MPIQQKKAAEEPVITTVVNENTHHGRESFGGGFTGSIGGGDAVEVGGGHSGGSRGGSRGGPTGGEGSGEPGASDPVELTIEDVKSDGGKTVTTLNKATGKTTVTEFDAAGNFVRKTTSTPDGTNLIEFAADADGTTSFLKTGILRDSAGNQVGTFRLDRVDGGDGHSTFKRVDTYNDGSVYTAQGAEDSSLDGNFSVTSRTEKPDGTIILSTSTSSDGGKHGTQHVQVIDRNGVVVSDTTTSY
ncbi:hypothetical protein [Streptomyces sp. NPDC101166]|uniref:hypothetical protein n=1 Tax=Streptomyces sp. NPDC101166 TaxID=3366120 RepID=UPI003828A808